MTRADVPGPGWFPDPAGGARLRWWDGTDWTDQYRPPPTAGELQRAAAQRERHELHGSATPGIVRSDVDEIIAQVRQIARTEVERATEQVSQRARTAARELQPLISEYTNRVFRWLRIALVLVVVGVVAWFAFQAIAQVTFLEWLGDRIDRLTD